MQTRHTLLSLVFASSLSACAAQQVQRDSNFAVADCASLKPDQTVASLYDPGRVRKVEPIYRQEFLARAIQPRYVSGAALYVPAEPGVTPAYMKRVLTCHAASVAEVHPDDPLRAEGVRTVTVSEVGPALRIAVVGADRSSGKAIWERARALEAQQGDVSVEQLSLAFPTHGSL